jgi:hypothetical protein
LKNNSRVIAPHPRTLDEVVGRNLPQWAVDFVKIDLERDHRSGLYLTLKLAQSHPNPHVRAMYRIAIEFFDILNGLMTQASSGDRIAGARALRMLHFPEAHELRLGYVSMGSYGNGIGNGELAEYLFDVLMRHPELRNALTREPDSLCFIPGIAMDRTSDIIATIAKTELVAFTQDQAQFWSFLPASLEMRLIEDCWNPATMQLENIHAEVPFDDLGRAFLLVPKSICRSVPPMKPEQYFRAIDPVGPKEGGGTQKQMLLDHTSSEPGALTKFAQERMKDPDNFRARREFRPKARD